MNKRRYLVIFLLVLIASSFANNIEIRASLPKDTFLLGEPLLLTLKFINLKSISEIIPYPDIQVGIGEGYLALYLITPGRQKKTAYTGLSMDGFERSTKELKAKDSVSTSRLFLWSNFLLFNADTLPEGVYTIGGKISFPDGSRKEIDTCSFYARALKGEDLLAFKSFSKNLGWFGWPFGSDERKTLNQAIPEVRKYKSKFVEYADYIFAGEGELSQGEKRNNAWRNFIKSYPTSPLAQRAWIWIVHFAEEGTEQENELQNLLNAYPTSAIDGGIKRIIEKYKKKK